MTTKGWLLAFFMFAVGWMMHDVSTELRTLLQSLIWWLETGQWIQYRVC
jgi:hypothetical protein